MGLCPLRVLAVAFESRLFLIPDQLGHLAGWQNCSDLRPRRQRQNLGGRNQMRMLPKLTFSNIYAELFGNRTFISKMKHF
jgi:hypothetical protein